MTKVKKDAVMRNLIAAAVFAPLVVLAGCSDSSNFLGLKTSKGVVYDGYLAGAKVCVDEITNRQCDDPPEPATFTDSEGGFQLTALTPEQARYPLVAEVVPGTIDLDTGLLAPAGLKYLAPAGSTAISAFSTIIQIRIENEIAAGLDLIPVSVPTLAVLKANAIAALATELGLPSGTDLTRYDPIAVKNNASRSPADRTTAAQLHIANRILSAQIAEFLPLALANADPGEESAAYAALLNNLDVSQVLADVQAATAGATLNDLIDPLFDIDTVPTADPAVPTAGEIDDQFFNDGNVLRAFASLIEGNPPITGATGG